MRDRLIPDSVEIAVLNELQRGIPIEKRPYKVIAARCGTDEGTVVATLEKYSGDGGLVRRISASFDKSRSPGVTALAAAFVVSGLMEKFISVVNACPEVSHNYERDGMPNVWFTVAAISHERIGEIIEEIKTRTGCDRIAVMRSKRLYKVSSFFEIKMDNLL